MKEGEIVILYSLILGVLAWILAGIAIGFKKKHGLLITGSFTLCCLSAMSQFIEIEKRVTAGDFGGIEDTIGSTITGIAVMMAVTVILCAAALLRKRT